MGLTKTQHFSEQQNQAAVFAKALGHPARIAILERLHSGTCVCGDLVDELPLSQSTISQHLKELKTAGLIKGEISGPRTCYCIDENVWQEARAMLDALFAAYQSTGQCC